MEPRPWHRHYDYNVPTTIRYPRLPVHELLGIPANAFPDKAALNFYGTEITFWELRLQVLRFAAALGELGIQKGDRVALHLPNCPQYPIAYYAALSLGAIIVNLNPMYALEEMKRMIGATGATTLITFDMVLPHVRGVCRDIRIPRVIVTKVTDYIKGLGVSTAASLGLDKGWHHFSTLIDRHPNPKRPRVQVNPEGPALIQFTGGTTGVPKGAVLTHANVIAGGFNVYPREIDEVFFQHPKVQEAVFVGIADPYRGETVKAYVVLKPGEKATERGDHRLLQGKIDGLQGAQES